LKAKVEVLDPRGERQPGRPQATCLGAGQTTRKFHLEGLGQKGLIGELFQAGRLQDRRQLAGQVGQIEVATQRRHAATSA
jgi:hypothetical protein